MPLPTQLEIAPDGRLLKLTTIYYLRQEGSGRQSNRTMRAVSNQKGTRPVEETKSDVFAVHCVL